MLGLLDSSLLFIALILESFLLHVKILVSLLVMDATQTLTVLQPTQPSSLLSTNANVNLGSLETDTLVHLNHVNMDNALDSMDHTNAQLETAYVNPHSPTTQKTLEMIYANAQMVDKSSTKTANQSVSLSENVSLNDGNVTNNNTLKSNVNPQVDLDLKTPLQI